MICVHKSVMQTHQWLARVPIYVAAHVLVMHRAAVLVWTKFVNVQYVLESVQSAAGVKIVKYPNKTSHEVLEKQAGRI